jgi:hypothetical protein
MRRSSTTTLVALVFAAGLLLGALIGLLVGGFAEPPGPTADDVAGDSRVTGPSADGGDRPAHGSSTRPGDDDSDPTGPAADQRGPAADAPGVGPPGPAANGNRLPGGDSPAGRPTGSARLDGVVVNAITGHGVAGVQIVAEWTPDRWSAGRPGFESHADARAAADASRTWTATTDAEGRFGLSGLPDGGTWHVTGRHPRFAVSEHADATPADPVRLTATGLRLVRLLIRTPTGEPAPAMNVEIASTRVPAAMPPSRFRHRPGAAPFLLPAGPVTISAFSPDSFLSGNTTATIPLPAADTTAEPVEIVLTLDGSTGFRIELDLSQTGVDPPSFRESVQFALLPWRDGQPLAELPALLGGPPTPDLELTRLGPARGGAVSELGLEPRLYALVASVGHQHLYATRLLDLRHGPVVDDWRMPPPPAESLVAVDVTGPRGPLPAQELRRLTVVGEYRFPTHSGSATRLPLIGTAPGRVWVRHAYPPDGARDEGLRAALRITHPDFGTQVANYAPSTPDALTIRFLPPATVRIDVPGASALSIREDLRVAIHTDRRVAYMTQPTYVRLDEAGSAVLESVAAGVDGWLLLLRTRTGSQFPQVLAAQPFTPVPGESRVSLPLPATADLRIELPDRSGDVTVTLFGPDRFQLRSPTSAGAIEIDGLPHGEYRISAPGYAMRVIELTGRQTVVLAGERPDTPEPRSLDAAPRGELAARSAPARPDPATSR